MLLKTYDKISEDTIYNWIIDCIDDSHNLLNQKDIISKVCIKEFQFINSKKYNPKDSFKKDSLKKNSFKRSSLKKVHKNYRKKIFNKKKKRFKGLSSKHRRFKNN